MSKRAKRLLSLVLTLVMVMSLGTPAFALGGGSEVGIGGGFGRDIGDDEVRDFDPSNLIEDAEEPVDLFSGVDTENGIQVTVESRNNALPTMAEVRVTPVDPESVREAVAAVVDGQPNVLVAMDISFWLDGIEIEPEEPVNVKISAPELTDRTGLQVVHIPDADGEEEAQPNTVELIGEDEMSIPVGTNEIAFKADSFSVYAIIGGENPDPSDDQPYRTTYEFYNADDSRYYFKDAAGRNQYTQILKNNEKLEDVGIPTKGASQNAKFVGWYVWKDDDTLGEKVEVGENKTVTKNETIRLKAKMQGIVNVMFVSAVMEGEGGEGGSTEGGGRSIVIVKQVEFTVGQSEPITVDTADVTTDAPKAEQAVVGWNQDENAANAGTAEGTGDNKTITLFTNTDDIHDVTLFPAIKNAYWLFFDENDGGTGGGASYTPPEFVMIGAKPTKPADPHRAGYTFGGWYKDAACTQAFSFDEPLDMTRRVYAKWVGAATTYTIVVWVQKTSDSASLPTNGQNRPEAERTYDFKRTFTINSTTGATATATSQSMGMGTTLDADGHIKYSRNDGPKTVAGNGSTVINVYYDRDVMTIYWYANAKGSWNNYVTDTWYGLYNATFAETNKTWKSGSWESDDYPISVMDSFVDFDTRAATSLNLYPDTESGSYHLYFYKENLSGGWDRVYDSRMGGNTTVTLAEKYKPGFDLDAYVRNNSTNYPTSGWTDATAGSTVNNNRNNVHVRYSRHTFNIEYHNGAQGTEGTTVRTDAVKFETSLSNHTNPTVSYPIAADAGHYEFIGWFADSTWTTMVTFTELDQETKDNYTDWYGISTFVVIDKMPANDFPLYAGYALKGWDCALDPNGGEFTNTSQAGVFWLKYGEKFSSDLKTNVKREGYIFQGWMVADVDGNLNTVTKNGLRFVGDNSNWTASDTPWEFSTGIEGPTYLQAKWFYKTALHVQYNANGGSNAPEDNGDYSDHATTVAFHAPTAPAGQNFLGWDIQGTDTVEKVKPGDTFEVSSDYAVDGVVTLVAVYSAPGSGEEVPVTHIDWYANNTETDTYDDPNFVPEEGEDEMPPTQVEMLLHVTDKDKQLNAPVDIRPADTFSNYGYKFLGWAKLHKDGETLKDHNNVTVAEATEADGVMDYALTADNLYLKYEDNKFWVESNDGWKETTQVAADEHTPYDDMYAVWEKEYFYVFHSSTGDLEAVAMPNNESGIFDLTSKVPEGQLYGGYYYSYLANEGFATEANKASAKADPTLKVNITSDVYDGSSLKKDNARYWTKAHAFTSTATEDMGGGIGTAMKPKAEFVYYLKEVPKAYLASRISYVYDWADDYKLVNLYLLTAVDDNYYSKVQFEVVVDNNPYAAKLVNSFAITQRNSNQQYVNRATDFADVTRGYVGYADVTSDLLKVGTFTMKPQWVTLDGVTVDGTARTFVITELTKDGITAK